MPATNYTPIQLYRTNTASTTAPSGANLNAGELAINYNDSGMILYAKNTSGTVIKLMNNPANLLYPTADGTANQVIKTNGSGVLSFATVVTSPGGSTTQVQYNNAGSFGGIANATTDGTTLSMTSPKIITAINDTNANELIKFTATASAVNEITVANAATTTNPVISATGGDTNIGITLTPKGTGGVTTANCLAVGGATPSTSGAGITFPATQSASTDANTLDDYEEGTWTPALKFGGNSAGMSISISGKYTKIGNVVYWACDFALSAKGSSSGSATITGLPFTSVTGYYPPSIVWAFNMNSLTGSVVYRVSNNSTTIDIYQYSSTGTNNALTNTEYNDSSQMRATGFYYIS